MNFLGKLWRGEIPLVLTFWGAGVAVPVVLMAPFWLFATYVQWRAGSAPPAAPAFPVSLMLLLAYFLCFIAALILVAVALWRSAGRYRGPWHWALGARGWIFVGLALLGWKMFAGG